MHHELGLAEQRALVSALKDALQAGQAPVELYETHVSWVLVAGADAYKIKKAVHFDFLDFSTLAQRLRFCRDEVCLNRRLAPRLYLGVVPIAGTPGGPVLCGEGEPIDYAVHMRAFPQEALWSRRLQAGVLGGAEVDALARQLAVFHAGAGRAPPESAWGTPQALRKMAEDNLSQLSAAATGEQREQVAALAAWQDERLRSLRPLFIERKAWGWIREGHGDLHCANILTIDGTVSVFDCIEFDEALRWIDVMQDIAFLTMDLRQRGQPALAARLLNGYLESTGDYEGATVLRYYEAQCAMVRAKIALLRAGQLEGDAAGAERGRAGKLLATALATAHPPPPVMVVMHGLTGSGKSTVARQLVEVLQAVQVRSDVERKRMRGIDPRSRPEVGLAAGLYDRTTTEAVYAGLGALAACLLKAGMSVVVDACSLQRRERDRFRAVGAALGVPVLLADVRAPEATLRERIRRRMAQGDDPSDADEAVLALQLRARVPLAPDELAHAVVLDSEAPFKPGPVLEALGRLAVPASPDTWPRP